MTPTDPPADRASGIPPIPIQPTLPVRTSSIEEAAEGNAAKEEPAVTQQSTAAPAQEVRITSQLTLPESVIEKYEAHCNEQRADENRRTMREESNIRRDKARMVVELLILIAAGLTVVFTCMQWREMRDTLSEMRVQTRDFSATLKETKRQSDAAFEANALTRESTRGRLAIKNIRLLEPITLGKGIAVVLEAANIGQTAIAVHSLAEAKRWKTLPGGDMPLKDLKPRQSTILEPGGNHGQITFVID